MTQLNVTDDTITSHLLLIGCWSEQKMHKSPIRVDKSNVQNKMVRKQFYQRKIAAIFTKYK